jgi:hypothetical protein
MGEASAGTCRLIPCYDAISRLKLSHTFNGIIFNNPADDPKETYHVESIVPLTTLTTTTEPHPKDDGSEMYDPHKIALIHRVTGRVYSATHAGLLAKVVALAGAVDPARLAHDNPTTGGFLPLTFDLIVPSFYNVRPRGCFDPPTAQIMGNQCPFTIDYVSRDPNRYFATLQTLTGAGTITNTTATYRSWPTLTLTMAGAGHAAYTITNTNSIATSSLVLNLSDCDAADVVTVNFETHAVSVVGTGTAKYVSGDWFYIEPVSNVITLANTTAATSVLTYYRAYSA